MRYSRQRELIFETLKNFETHPTAEQLYIQVKQEMPQISLGTVYRNLNILVEKGKIRKVDSLESSSVRYDARSDEHSHLVCTKCGTVKDLDLSYFYSVDKLLKEKFDFTVTEHNIVLKGLCSDCSLTEK
ncbi:MAG: transcriptional repressor [Sphaerochaetaceae bacterium]